MVRKFPYGLQTFVINQMRGLLDKGHDVHVWTFSKVDSHLPQDLAKYNFDGKVYCKRLPKNERKFDAILCQEGVLAQKYFALKNSRDGLQGKLLVFFRGYDASGYIDQYPNVYDHLFKVGDLLLPVCNHFRNRLVTAGCNPDKIQVLHSAIDCSKFPFLPRSFKRDGKVRIVQINRLVSKKGIEYSIQALAKVLGKHKNVEFFIIGEGPLRNRLERLIKKLNVEHAIKLLGRVSHEDVARMLSEAHLYIQPSRTPVYGTQEGIPNALKEAMAIGLPVVSTYHSGIPELVDDGESGFLVPENDADALAEKIEYLIEHPATWNTMGRKGRQKVEAEFDMIKENDRLEQILYSVVSKGRSN